MRSDATNSAVAMLPDVHRTGVAIGDVKGTSESVRAKPELGSLVRPMIER